MQVRSAFINFDNWLGNLSIVRYVIFVWLSTFTVSLLIGITLAGNTLNNAVVSAVGGAIGVTLVLGLGRWFSG
jgi:4-hydroxy-3-methylbut-2-en-1-yl diphosphate synthase IspG/GcpE